MKEISYPIRINKYLAYKGICSRREADQLIAKKKIYLNGEVATLGAKVEKNDTVELHKGLKREYVYIAYNKPRGIVSHSAKEGEVDISQEIGRDDIFPLGRLDKDSEGLILLTNDGRITEKLLSPESAHEKEYLITVDKPLKKNTITKLKNGVNIEGYVTKPCKAKMQGSKTLTIILTEGKKHQVRRMLAALGYTTLKLKRVRIANILLSGLAQGSVRTIKDEELKTFLNTIGLS